MPTYDYECQACGHHFELFQSMSAKVLRKCPECAKPKLQRLIGPGAGFLFKGDGFYITDYRSDSYKAGQKAAEDKPKEGSADGGGKDSGAKEGGSGKDSGTGGGSQPKPKSKPKPKPSAGTSKS